MRQRRILRRTVGAAAVIALGMLLMLFAALTNSYLHRGIETGDTMSVVVHPTKGEPATNVDLTRFPESERASVAEALRASGFRYVRQPFSWRIIEQRPGEFDWTAYDSIVSELANQQISVVAVARDVPTWALREGGEASAGSQPADADGFGSFVQTLTSRYRDAVPFVQLWEAPNDPAHWGGRSAVATEFVPFLAAGFNGANMGFPAVQVIAPELAIDPPGEASTDIDFLQSLYDAGGAEYFDIVAVRAEGGVAPPEDRRVSSDRLNLSRVILFRELAVQSEDETTPIWATSFGWAISEQVSAEDQATFTADALERSWSEWPWMGQMVHMAFVAEEETLAAPYAMVDDEGRATPLYLRLTDESLAGRSKVATTGFTSMDSAAVIYQGNWQSQHLEGQTFQTTSQAQSSASITFDGTGLMGIVRYGPESGRARVTLDGQLIPGGAGPGGLLWNFYAAQSNDLLRTLVQNLEYTRHQLTISLETNGTLTLGGTVVVRDTPFLWPVILLTAAAGVALFTAIRSLLYLVATRSGQLQPRAGADLWPQLPLLPDWRPSRRL